VAQGLQDVIQSAPSERGRLRALQDALSKVPAGTTFCLAGPDEQPLELPESLYRTLRDAVKILLQGSAVAISPLQRLLSTTEAGDLLGVSRQYLTRIIDRGDLPCERTGRHRRILLSDLLEYKRERDAARRAALDELTAQAAEMGAYD
jgi:excisionase family DNA binding protein